MSSAPDTVGDRSPRIPQVAWRSLAGIAAVQATIGLAWVVYLLYVPQLLAMLGLPAKLGSMLLVAENLVNVGVEPLCGGLCDRQRRQWGTQMPFVIVGILLAASSFLCLPAIALLGNASNLARGLLAFAIMAWAIAMASFRSPVLGLLGKCAAKADLPWANGFLTFVRASVDSLRPLAGQSLLSWGAPVTFAVSSFSLLGAAAFLRARDPDLLSSPLPSQPTEPRPLHPLTMGHIFLTGAAIGAAFRLLFGEVMPRAETALHASPIGGWLLFAFALCALPAGYCGQRFGNRRTMAVGIALTVPALLLAGVFPRGTLVLLAIAAFGFSGVFNGGVPLAIAALPPARSGLATGFYFGGFSAAVAGLGWLLPQVAWFSWEAGAMAASAACLGVAFLVAATPRSPGDTTA